LWSCDRVGSPQVTVPQLRPLPAADKLPPLIIKGRWVIKRGSMDKLCPDIAQLAREFRAQPHGRHSAELQRVLSRMRSEPFAGHHVLIQEHRGSPYRLARFGTAPADPVSYTGDTFATLEQAEWAVFKLRWRTLFGSDLPVE
jgi:hypothetical protein